MFNFSILNLKNEIYERINEVIDVIKFIKQKLATISNKEDNDKYYVKVLDEIKNSNKAEFNSLFDNLKKLSYEQITQFRDNIATFLPKDKGDKQKGMEIFALLDINNDFARDLYYLLASINVSQKGKKKSLLKVLRLLMTINRE